MTKKVSKTIRREQQYVWRSRHQDEAVENMRRIIKDNERWRADGGTKKWEHIFMEIDEGDDESIADMMNDEIQAIVWYSVSAILSYDFTYTVTD